MTSEPRARLWPAYLATYTFMTGSWAAAIAVPLHVILLGGSLAEAGVLAAIRFGLSAFLQLPFGAVTDAWGTRRALVIATSARLQMRPMPLLILMILASNIGGTATLIGDPPNLMVGSRAKLDFMAFVQHLGPAVVVMLSRVALTFSKAIQASPTATPAATPFHWRRSNVSARPPAPWPGC